jgi:oligopeptide/dipeptide ABC transporter ATP-binding protein
MQEKNKILSVKNLNVYYPAATEKKPVKLLDNIGFSLNKGEIIGVVGETGSGKTILIDAIGQDVKPPLWAEADEITTFFNGIPDKLVEKDDEEMRNIWGNKMAFIPSNARERLNPVLKVGIQVCNVIQDNLGLSEKDAKEKTLDMFRLVSLPDPERNFEMYPHEFSGGMAQRAVISIALSTSPKLLLADEPTMGLDVTIQAQILDNLNDLIEEFHSSVLLSTRDLGIVANYCNMVAVIGEGQLVEFGSVADFFKNPRHPYSRYLLKAAFASHGKGSDLQSEIEKPELVEKRLEAGCRFAHRCKISQDVCWHETPPAIFPTPGSLVRCHRQQEI